MLEKQKEQQTQLFNFFKFQKKEEHNAVKAGKYTFKAAFGVFKFLSYSFGTLFFIGAAMSIINSPSKEERVQIGQKIFSKNIKPESFYSKKVGEASYEIVDLVKTAKSSKETIKALNDKYKQSIIFSYADEDMISFVYNVDYKVDYNVDSRPSFYVIKFDNKLTNIRLVNSSPQIHKEFETFSKDRKDIVWSKNSNNLFDKNLRNDYLSVDIKS